ncbi:MAG: hypothetical protein AAB421_04380 [Patescibacteria group bacterium]
MGEGINKVVDDWRTGKDVPTIKAEISGRLADPIVQAALATIEREYRDSRGVLARTTLLSALRIVVNTGYLGIAGAARIASPSNAPMLKGAVSKTVADTSEFFGALADAIKRKASVVETRLTGVETRYAKP